MIAPGIALLLLGAALVAGEAHVPGGVLGGAGAVALIVGAVVVIGAAGGSAAVAAPAAIGLGVAAGGFAVLAARAGAGVRRGRVRAGAEALSGRVGVVRHWNEPGGQIFVSGALWRARHDDGPDEEPALREGEQVVVQHVHGLTLGVRRAEAWELPE